MKHMLLLFGCLIFLAGNAQDDPYYGKIKIRKPHPVSFFVDIDSTPVYVPGGLEESIYSQLVRPEPWNPADYPNKGLVVIRTIIDERGNVIHVESKTAKSALSNEAGRVIEKLGRFQPHVLEGKAVPARFDIPVNFNW